MQVPDEKIWDLNNNEISDKVLKGNGSFIFTETEPEHVVVIVHIRVCVYIYFHPS